MRPPGLAVRARPFRGSSNALSRAPELSAHEKAERSPPCARAVAAIAAAEKTTGLLALDFLDGGPPAARSADGDGPLEEAAIGELDSPCGGRSRSGEVCGVTIAVAVLAA